MMRDYADMLWSSYNFWCKREYDGVNCDYSKWAVAGLHSRSPEEFHALIEADAAHNKSVVQPFYYPMERPCINAGGYYNEYIGMHLHSRQLQNSTILIASEELEAFPMAVARRVAHIIRYNIDGMNTSTLFSTRVNTQEAKGTDAVVSADSYKPGLYNISNYRPMLPETRTLLNKCWHDDCMKVAQIAPKYRYSACYPEMFEAVAYSKHIEETGQHFRRTGTVAIPLHGKG
jgi:hypothetical protein